MDSLNLNFDSTEGQPTIMADQTADIVTYEAQIPLECAIDESALVKKVRRRSVFFKKPELIVFFSYVCRLRAMGIHKY